MKDIETLLRENKPEEPSGDGFILEVNARLDSVEGIKKVVDEERRRGRQALFIALAAGVVAGCALSILAVSYPIDTESVELTFLNEFADTLRSWKEYIFAGTALLSAALGLLLVTRKKQHI